MAVYLAAANGNFSAGSTWALVDAATFLDSEAGNTVLTTSPVASQAAIAGVVTVDGIAVKLTARAASPSGTITVELYNSTSSSSVDSTTINISDLPIGARAGWVFFKFGSSHTLISATNYVVRLSTSQANQVSAYRNATAGNWSCALRTTTTGVAPVAGDTLIICGERTGAGAVTTRTVTYDVTATTAWGSPSTVSATAIAVCDAGTMQGQTTASTTYNMYCAGNIEIMGNGAWTFNNLASTSTLTINLSSSGSTAGTGVLTATYYGLIITAPASFTMVGKTVTNVSALLAADLSASGTSATLNLSSGWAVGDVVVFAPTGQTATQGEKKTLTSASGTSIGFSAVANAHSGTSPNQAEVIHLNRSIVVQGNSTNGGYVQTNGSTQGFTFQYVEFTNLGQATSNTFTINNTGGGAKTIQYCTFHDFVSATHGNCIITTSAAVDALTIDSNNFWDLRFVNVANGYFHIDLVTTSGTMTCTNNVIIGLGTFNGAGIILGVFAGTFTGNTISGLFAGNAGAIITMGGALTVSGNLTHACGVGLLVIPLLQSLAPAWASQIIPWVARRCGVGFSINSGNGGVVSGSTLTITAVACSTAGIQLGASTAAFSMSVINTTFLNCVLAGDSSFAQPVGLQFFYGFPVAGCTFSGCTFGVGTAHTTADIQFNNAGCDVSAVFLNCNLASTGVEVVSQANMTPSSSIGHEAWKQTAGSHRTYFQGGTLTYDSTIYGAASPSARLTPISATAGSFASDIGISLRCNSGVAVTATLWVRTSAAGDGAAYNGAAPYIVQKANPALGIASDSTLATWSGAAGTGQAISFTTSVPTDDGVITIVVSCNGTAGWVNVDDLIPQ